MRRKLLDLIKAGRDKEESDLLPDVNDAPPDESGRWTAKDQLAHLTAWRQVAVAEMDAVRTGGPAPDVSDDDNVESAKTYKKTRLRRPQQPLWQAIPNNTYFHLAEHLAYWHIDRGDAAAAEEAAKWGYELATSTFPDNRARGLAVYNLGCFYAKHDRAADAMPYLRKGIELRPELRDWAKQDTDLDPLDPGAR
jgi:tetratricopeptide (TPR) repeat protein